METTMNPTDTQAKKPETVASNVEPARPHRAAWCGGTVKEVGPLRELTGGRDRFLVALP
jgi:hypothetical protein